MDIFWFGFAYGLGAVLTYGVSFAYWQRRWPTLSDGERGIDSFSAAIAAALWPLFLPISVIVFWIGDKRFPLRYGLKFRWEDD